MGSCLILRTLPVFERIKKHFSFESTYDRLFSTARKVLSYLLEIENIFLSSINIAKIEENIIVRIVLNIKN